MSSTNTSAAQCLVPVANQGWWADRSIPLFQGTSSAAIDRAAPVSWPRAAEPGPEVRELCYAAKEQAEVGGDIRWDVILEQAAQMACALRLQAPGVRKASPMPKDCAAKLEDDDEGSTSAGGICSEGAEGTSSAEGTASSSDSEAEGMAGTDSQPRCPPMLADKACDDLASCKTIPNACTRYATPLLLQLRALLLSVPAPSPRPAGLPRSMPEQALRAMEVGEVEAPPGLQRGTDAGEEETAAELPCLAPDVSKPPGLSGTRSQADASHVLKDAPWRHSRAKADATTEDEAEANSSRVLRDAPWRRPKAKATAVAVQEDEDL